MEYLKESILYVIGLILVIIIAYILYLVYKDLVYLRSEVSTLHTSVGALTEFHNTDEDFNTECEDGLNTADSIDCCDVNDDYIVSKKTNIFDNLMMNSDELQNLQDFQKEITNQLPVISEVPEYLGCKKILKTGKNKGNECGKQVVQDTDFCKNHQDEPVIP
jgi:hypothetical protein